MNNAFPRTLCLFVSVLLLGALPVLAQKAKPAAKLPVKVVPKAAAAKPETDQPLYSPQRAVWISNPKEIVLNYNAETLNPLFDKYNPYFPVDSVKPMLRLTQPAHFPAGINTPEKFAARHEDIKKYKAYMMHYFREAGTQKFLIIYWIPRSENKQLPADMVPQTAAGIYLVGSGNTYTYRLSEKKSIAAAPESHGLKGLVRVLPTSVSYLNYALVHQLDAAGLQRAKATFVGSDQFTEEEWADIARRTHIANFPAGLNTAKKIDRNSSAFSDAKAYIQGSFLLPFNGIAQIIDLVWLPRAENKELPANLLPVQGDLYFFIVQDYLNYGTPASARFVRNKAPEAVAAMKAKHSKATPESPSAEPAYDYRTYHMYKPLRDLGYTEEEFVRITELLSKRYVPEGLEYDYYQLFKDSLRNYKAYRLTEFSDDYGRVRLYWLPKEENGHMPKALRPLTDEGAFLLTRVQRTEENKALSSKMLSNKPEWEIYPELYRFYTKGGTDAQIAQMEQDRKAGIGTGSGGSSGTNGRTPLKMTATQVSEMNAAYKKMIRELEVLDAQFEPYGKMLLKPPHEVFLSIQWKLRARRIVDQQKWVIDDYLKKWGGYLTESEFNSFKARLGQIQSMVYRIGG